MGINVSFSVSTPSKGKVKKDIKTGDLGKSVMEELEISEYSLVLEGLVKSYVEYNMETLMIEAIYFQRLCARTPLDEPYDYKSQSKSGKKKGRKHHEPDDDYVRYRWCMECEGKRIPAMYFHLLRDDFFTKVNDRRDINEIFDVMKQRFNPDGGRIIGKISVVNEADNQEVVTILEYGLYSHDSQSISSGKKYKHGVELKHSVQAPAGMIRVTNAERSSIFAEASNSKEYKKTSYGKNFNRISRSKVKELIPFLKRQKFSASEMNFILKKAGVL